MLKLRSYFPAKYNDSIERFWFADSIENVYEIHMPPTHFVDLLIPLNSGEFFSETYVEGLIYNNVHLKILPETKVLGIRFYPNGFYPFDSMPGKNIYNRAVGYSSKDRYKRYVN